MRGCVVLVAFVAAACAGCAAGPRMGQFAGQSRRPDEVPTVRASDSALRGGGGASARGVTGNPDRDRLQEAFEREDRQLQEAREGVKSLSGQPPILELPLQ